MPKTRSERHRSNDVKTGLMHRLTTSAPKGKVLDHDDNDGLNDRRLNLRITTTRNNVRRASKHADETTSVFKDDYSAEMVSCNSGCRGFGFILPGKDANAIYDRLLPQIEKIPIRGR